MWAILALMSARTTKLGGAAVGAASKHSSVAVDHYALLNVDPSVDALEIRSAYRRAALTAHPDKGGSTEAFNLVAEAFNILSCPHTRFLHDIERTENLQHLKCLTGAKRHAKDKQNLRGAHAMRNASLRVDQALQDLHVFLQKIDKSSREELMSHVPLEVQKALMEFMGSEKKFAKASETTERQRKAPSGCIRLHTKESVTSGKKSNAQLDIEHLRFYTRWTSVDTAIEHQLVLSKLQGCLVAASDTDKEFWSRPEEVCRVFEEVLSELGLSNAQFGVSVYVEMRAPEWVANSQRITSSVLPLEAAVSLRSRLLHARSTSWECLRAEWINLLVGGKFGRRPEEAEAHVNRARCDFMKQQLQIILQNVKRAMDVQGLINDKIKTRVENTEKRLADKEASKTAKLQGKRRRILVQMNNTSDVDFSTTWPYLSAQRLQAHNMAYESNETSAIE